MSDSMSVALAAFQSEHRLTDDMLARYLRCPEMMLKALRAAPRPWSMEEVEAICRKVPADPRRLASAMSLAPLVREKGAAL